MPHTHPTHPTPPPCSSYRRQVLFRVGIALLQRHKAALLACTSAEHVRVALRVRLQGEGDACALMAAAFRLPSFTLHSIHKLQRRELRLHGSAGRVPRLEPVPQRERPPPALLHTGASSSFFIPRLVDSQRELLATLDLDVRQQLWAALPTAERGRDGVLVYCNLTHGSSLRTLYALCEAAGVSTRGAIVVARALDGRGVFGGYTSHGVRQSAGQPYGSGESFLFAASERVVGAGVRTYGWTRQNDLFAHGDATYWAMGGGRTGSFGLSVDDDVCGGSSAPCETFGLDASLHDASAERFRYAVLEVWALQ